MSVAVVESSMRTLSYFWEEFSDKTGEIVGGGQSGEIQHMKAMQSCGKQNFFGIKTGMLSTAAGNYPILVAVAWASDEGGGEIGIGGTIKRHRELAKRNGSHHQIARKTGQISVIPHIENGGCKEMGDISDLGWAVKTDVGIEQGWQRRGHWCSHSCCLGVVHHILRCRINTQMGVFVAAFNGRWGFDLGPILLLTPFHPPASSPGYSPPTVPMPYLPSYG
ncbi:hypothetical protein EDD85DRAFT_983362 [Armillaria nabsnona]|nr:hypothetical protein EDD85DRAFT_983362 [Armillaria nabsnona]